jgi:hypothetical protein
MWTAGVLEMATADGFSVRDLRRYKCIRCPKGEGPRYSNDADEYGSLPGSADKKGEPHGPGKERMGQEPGTTKSKPVNDAFREDRMTWSFVVKVTGCNKEWEKNIG